MRMHSLSIIILILIIVILSAIFLYTINLHSNINQDLDSQIALIRKSRLPVSIKELEAWYQQVPDEDNAAIEYIKAFKLFSLDNIQRFTRMPVLGDSSLPAFGDNITPECIIDIKSCLDANNIAIEILSSGCHKKYCRYPIDLNIGVGFDGYVADITMGCRLFILNAIFSAYNNNNKQSMENIYNSIRLASSLINEPSIPYSLQGITLVLTSLDILEWIFSRITLSDAELLIACNISDTESNLNKMQWVIIGERCLGIETFYKTLFKANNSNIEKQVLTMDFLEYLNLMDRLMKSFNLTAVNRINVCDDILLGGNNMPNKYVLTKMLFPPVAWYAIAENNMYARLRSVRVAAAVEKYHSARKVYPEKATDLIPIYLKNMPLDPYGIRELKYKHSSSGYTIYSIGKDGEDNGGIVNDDGKSDVIFSVQR